MKRINDFLYTITIVVVGVICSACPVCDLDRGDLHDVDFINKSNDIVYISVLSSSKKQEVTIKDVFERSKYYPSYMIRVDADSTVKVNMVYDQQVDDRWYYQVIIISQHTLDSHSKEEITEKNIYDDEIVMRCTKLKAMDFKIVYTGENKDGGM